MGLGNSRPALAGPPIASESMPSVAPAAPVVAGTAPVATAPPRNIGADDAVENAVRVLVNSALEAYFERRRGGAGDAVRTPGNSVGVAGTGRGAAGAGVEVRAAAAASAARIESVANGRVPRELAARGGGWAAGTNRGHSAGSKRGREAANDASGNRLRSTRAEESESCSESDTGLDFGLRCDPSDEDDDVGDEELHSSEDDEGWRPPPRRTRYDADADADADGDGDGDGDGGGGGGDTGTRRSSRRSGAASRALPADRTAAARRAYNLKRALKKEKAARRAAQRFEEAKKAPTVAVPKAPAPSRFTSGERY